MSLSLFALAEAFVATARPALRATARATETAAPVMTLEEPMMALAQLPTTTTLAAVDTNILLAAGVGSLIFVLGVVAAIVTRTLVTKK